MIIKHFDSFDYSKNKKHRLLATLHTASLAPSMNVLIRLHFLSSERFQAILM